MLPDDFDAVVDKNLRSPEVARALGLEDESGGLERRDTSPDDPYPRVASRRLPESGGGQDFVAIGWLAIMVAIFVPMWFFIDPAPTRAPDSLLSEDLQEPTGHPLVVTETWYHDGVPATQSFAGYECTDDCSGHIAGYDWAEEQGITDPDDCGGNSQSFIEGCEAWAEENG